MSTSFFQADSGAEKMIVRINPDEVVKIIEDPLGFPASGRKSRGLSPGNSEGISRGNFDVYSRVGVILFTSQYKIG